MLLLPTFNAKLDFCPLSPAEFSPHAQGNFCGQCQRVVHDFSQSTDPGADLAAAPGGRVGDVRIAKGLHPLLDAEVVHEIQKLTGFTQPLQSNGKRHVTSMTIPIEFKIR